MRLSLFLWERFFFVFCLIFGAQQILQFIDDLVILIYANVAVLKFIAEKKM